MQQSGDRLASVGEAKDESAIETPSKRLNLLSAIEMMNEIQGDKKISMFMEQD